MQCKRAFNFKLEKKIGFLATEIVLDEGLMRYMTFLYKKTFYKKMSLKKPKKLEKMLRNSPASSAYKLQFLKMLIFLELFKLKVTKLSKF